MVRLRGWPLCPLPFTPSGLLQLKLQERRGFWSMSGVTSPIRQRARDGDVHLREHLKRSRPPPASSAALTNLASWGSGTASR